MAGLQLYVIGQMEKEIEMTFSLSVISYQSLHVEPSLVNEAPSQLC